MRSWKGNPAHFPFHANAWKRPHPKTRAPEHIGIYCPCTQVSNSDDSLSGVLESRVRFFRLALLPFPFRCRMVGENRAKEIGRFPSFRNISALSVELLRRRGICGTTGTRSERDAGAAGSPMSGPPGRRPRKGLSRRINETPPSQQEGMAWTHGSTGSVFWVLPLSQDGSFSANRWRKTNLRRGKRMYGRTLRFSPRARGFAGRKGMTVMAVMAMETGMGTTEPRLRRIAARPNQEVFLSQQSRERPASLNITKALPDTVREGLRGILHFRNRYSRSSPFTSMRYLRIFDQRVLGLRPRSSAAPSCPEILPLVRLSALMI